jgi:phenylpropionate dioxygenase-like ring-hydroxylating dioxygenase large terminal subunit
MPSGMAEPPARRRGLGVPRQGTDGYDQNWYPIGFSREVGPGQVVAKDFLDGRVIMYRGASGGVAVLSAYCRHLGADLSRGSVVGDDIRCAFHHWQYGPDGACTRIPIADRVPPDVALFRFPCAEAWDLVWAFNGPEPLFDVPTFPLAVPHLVFRTVEACELPVDPWMLLTNSVDFQHLRVLHGLRIDCDPRTIAFRNHSVEYDVVFEDPNIGVFEQHVKVFGTNTITLTGKMAGADMLTMFSGLPLPSRNTRGWVVTGTRGDADQAEVAARLAAGEAFFLGLIAEDNPIMETIRFREDVLLSADQALARFLKYVRGYPRAHPSADFIT